MPRKLSGSDKKRVREIEELGARLAEADETLRAIREGDLDALVVSNVAGKKLLALEGASQPYRLLIENMSEGAFTLTPEGVILYANRRFAEMLRTPLEKVISSDIHVWFSSESRQVVQTLLRKDAVGSRSEELTLAAADGTQVPVYLSMNRLLLDGVPESLCVVATDLTEQKRNEAMLAAEKLARAILEQAADAIIICDETGRIIRASKQAQVFYDNNLIGQLFEHAFPLCLLDGTSFAALDRIDSSRRQSVEAVLDRNGRRFDFLVSVGRLKSADEELLGSLVTLTDITERKRAQDELQELSRKTERRERIFSTMLGSITDFAYIFDPQGRFLFANQPLLTLLGTTLEAAVGKNFFELGYPEELAEKLQRQVQEVFETRTSVTDETPFTSAAGLTGYYEYIFSPVVAVHGTVEFVVGATRDVTERKRAETALRTSEADFRILAEAMPQIVWITRPDGWNIYFNQHWMDYTGLTIDQSLGHGWSKPFHPDDQEQARSAWKRATATIGTYSIESRLRRADGVYRWWLVRGVPLRDATGNILKWFGTCTDIHDLKVAEIEITRSNQVLRENEVRIRNMNRVYAMLSGINTLIVHVRDRDELFREACRIAVEEGGFRMTWIGLADRSAMKIVPVASVGVDEEILVAIKDTSLLSEAAPLGNTMTARAFREKKAIVSNDSQGDSRVLLGSKHIEAGIRSMAFFPLIVSDEAVGVLALYAREIDFFHEDEMKLLTELAGDVSFAIDHLENQEQLHYLAFYDALTGLANRALLQDRLLQAIQFAERFHLDVVALVVNLDRFKLVNDTLGHAAGDDVLKVAGGRLLACVRDVDTVARFGADEFVVILAGTEPDGDGVLLIVQRFLDAFATPIVLAKQELFITCSIGAAIYPRDAENADMLLKDASAAMYRAKEHGRNNVQFYSPDTDARAGERLALESALRRALEREELSLHYQPQVDLRTGQVFGFEALIRWKHPDLGSVSPARFIPIAEETGLILPIGEWVLRTAAQQNKAWQDAGLAQVRVAVNLSAQQFRQKDLPSRIQRILADTGLESKYLDVELTEGMLMRDIESAVGMMSELRRLGVQISLDDFGTGYSSLSYLKRFRIDTLKIDQSFVREVTSDPDSAAIVDAIVAMAHSLRLTVIAEGVETDGQLAFLRAHNCDQMQGYLFSKPLPGDELAQLLRDRRSLPPPSSVAESATILLLDDEPNVLAALRRLLRSEGYRILTADTPGAAFELLAQHRVQVILSDQRMPSMTGTEFFGRVKDLYPHTVRIMLSGYSEIKAVTEAINKGAVYKFLSKPWDDEELRAVVKEAFQRFVGQQL